MKVLFYALLAAISCQKLTFEPKYNVRYFNKIKDIVFLNSDEFVDGDKVIVESIQSHEVVDSSYDHLFIYLMSGVIKQRQRNLVDEDQVYQHNSWDNMEWNKEREGEAIEIIKSQMENSPLINTKDSIKKYVEDTGAQKWTQFYLQHDRFFFKNRNWLEQEFPLLFSENTKLILEIGCGAGNTVWPLARVRKDDPDVFIWACDWARSAVDLVKEFREYNPTRMHGFHHDLTSKALLPTPPLDCIVSIFVLSAIAPPLLPQVMKKLFSALKPGGHLLFRDYGLYDMTQLRFKPNRLVDDNVYIRGDGTAVHYFGEDEWRGLAEHAGFEIIECKMDERLLVNRQRKLTMYRRWLQSTLRRPI